MFSATLEAEQIKGVSMGRGRRKGRICLLHWFVLLYTQCTSRTETILRNAPLNKGGRAVNTDQLVLCYLFRRSSDGSAHAQLCYLINNHNMFIQCNAQCVNMMTHDSVCFVIQAEKAFLSGSYK